jgi:hypothetical protein
MAEYNGTVRGQQIELDEDPGLLPGTRVRIKLEPAPLSLEEKREAFRSVFGACKDDPSFADAVEQIVASRQDFPPRPFDLFPDE